MPAKQVRFADQAVAAVFKSYPPALRTRLLHLRNLIFATAKATQGVGALDETLKWGQPSYLTAESKSGTTIRIDALKGSETGYAMYVHCQTGLIGQFREHYGERLNFEGNRAILFDTRRKLPETAVKHCVSLALTYHRKRSSKS